MLIKISTSLAAIAILSACALTGCTVNVGSNGAANLNPGTSSQAQDSGSTSAQISAYKSALKSLASRESDIIDRYDAVSGENYTDDQTMYLAVQGILPDLQLFIGDLEAITPEGAELQAIHENYVEGWNLQAKGMTLVVSALENQDSSQVAEANDALAQGRKLIRETVAAIKALP
jgi:hypothetical protein